MKKITLLLSLFFLAVTSYGQVVLAGWDVSGTNAGAYAGPSYSFSSTTVGANISGGALTLGAGVAPNTTNNNYGFQVSGGDGGAPSLANSISNNYYLQFTLNAASGYTFSLSSIDIVGEANASGSNNVALLTSVDGFTDGAEIATKSGAAGITGGLDSDDSGFNAITLGGSQYNNLSSITFRIYGWSMSGSGATRIRNLGGTDSDLVINGTTAVSAVPEPSTYALIFGVAILGFCMYRRRAKRVN